MLTDLDSIKDFLEVPSNTTSYDQLLTDIAEQVQGRFEQYVQYPILFEAGVEFICDATGLPDVILPRLPVVAVTSVVYDADSDFTGSPVDAADYRFDSKMGLIRWLPGKIPAPAAQAIQVIYDAGYNQGSVSYEILRAYMAQIRHEFEERHQMGKSSIADGSSTVRVIGFELLDDVEKTLESLRRREW